jgi:hypothetical protein
MFLDLFSYINMEQQTNLTVIVKNSSLDEQESKSILERFGDYEELAREWEIKAKQIVVSKSSDTIEMAMAKEARKKFSDLRRDVEKSRKAMKEQSLRKVQAIDAIARYLTSLITPIENYLKSQEDFVQIQVEKEAEKLRLEAEAKAEADRLAKEEADRKEQERIRKENEQLKKEAEEKQKAMEAERKKMEEERIKANKKLEEERIEKDRLIQLEKDKAEAERKKMEAEQNEKLEEERVKRAKIEQELKAKKDEEERIKKEAEDKEAKRLLDLEQAKQAELNKSEVEKFKTYISNLLQVEVPEGLGKWEGQAKYIRYTLCRKIDVLMESIQSSSVECTMDENCKCDDCKAETEFMQTRGART